MQLCMMVSCSYLLISIDQSMINVLFYLILYVCITSIRIYLLAIIIIYYLPVIRHLHLSLPDCYFYLLSKSCISLAHSLAKAHLASKIWSKSEICTSL